MDLLIMLGIALGGFFIGQAILLGLQQARGLFDRARQARLARSASVSGYKAVVEELASIRGRLDALEGK